MQLLHPGLITFFFYKLLRIFFAIGYFFFKLFFPSLLCQPQQKQRNLINCRYWQIVKIDVFSKRNLRGLLDLPAKDIKYTTK